LVASDISDPPDDEDSQLANSSISSSASQKADNLRMEELVQKKLIENKEQDDAHQCTTKLFASVFYSQDFIVAAAIDI
jgi:hypothetical protein